MKTLESEELRLQTIELLRYIVGRVESEDILALFFRTVFLRDDMLGSVSNLLAKSASEALDQPMIKDKFGKFVLQIANNSNVKNELYNSYLIKPAKKFFSLGLIGDDDNSNGNGNNGNSD